MAAAQLTAQHMFHAEQRRARRDDVFFPTTLWSPDLGQIEVQVVNISPHGFMARVREEVIQGGTVRLRLPESNPQPATVVWALGGRLGAEFATPIEPATYGAMLHAMSNPRAGWQLR